MLPRPLQRRVRRLLVSRYAADIVSAYSGLPTWLLHSLKGSQTFIVSVFPSPAETSTAVTTQVFPDCESIKNVCRAAKPDVNRINRGWFGLVVFGRRSTVIAFHVFSSFGVFTNCQTFPVNRSKRNVHWAANTAGPGVHKRCCRSCRLLLSERSFYCGYFCGPDPILNFPLKYFSLISVASDAHFSSPLHLITMRL